MLTPLSWAEPVTLCIVIAYLAVQKRYFKDRFGEFIRSYTVFVPTAWMCENSVIHAYGFYAYSDGWMARLDQTPVMVAIIWPIVVLSALTLAQRIRRLWPIPETGLVAMLVVADAALMEAIATSTGLWSWTMPGPFGVPLMGVWGWGCFAVASFTLLRWTKSYSSGWVRFVAVGVGTLIGTHGLLLVSWWGCFRWVDWFPGDAAVAGLAVIVGGVLARIAHRERHRLQVPLPELVSRAVAAVYFFALLFVYNFENYALLVFSCAFAPPYLALITRASNRFVSGGLPPP